jgi:ubiquinone/menaquinone biosynthesis C-methylase UbiE
VGGSWHYDTFSHFYDLVTEPVHRQHRLHVAELLHLAPGDTVLDVPCGTGANFPILRALVGATGRVVGCDASPGMLNRAHRKIRKVGWQNVEAIEADARIVTRELLGTSRVDAVVSMLGMTVMPDWEDVFARTYDVLEPGGRYVIMDLYLAEQRGSRVADGFFHLVARADSTRRFWEPLQARVADFTCRDDPRFGGVARIVAGTKPSG